MQRYFAILANTIGYHNRFLSSSAVRLDRRNLPDIVQSMFGSMSSSSIQVMYPARASIRSHRSDRAAVPTPTLRSTLELENEQHIHWQHHPSNGKICGMKVTGGCSRSFDALQDM
uniref:Uncharacterized protein n=1 Tax=Amphimedon queenslandica TaxID=400682 RepID=A0A1X7U3M9_AMPQE